jgi:hypothetical protein
MNQIHIVVRTTHCSIQQNGMNCDRILDLSEWDILVKFLTWLRVLFTPYFQNLKQLFYREFKDLLLSDFPTIVIFLLYILSEWLSPMKRRVALSKDTIQSIQARTYQSHEIPYILLCYQNILVYTVFSLCNIRKHYFSGCITGEGFPTRHSLLYLWDAMYQERFEVMCRKCVKVRHKTGRLV